MDSLFSNTVWIIAYALSRVCWLANSILAKIKINPIITFLESSYQHRSFKDLTFCFKSINKAYIYNIIALTRPQPEIFNIPKTNKLLFNIKLQIKKLINIISSAYQVKPSFPLYQNVLSKTAVYLLMIKPLHTVMVIDPDIGNT